MSVARAIFAPQAAFTMGSFRKIEQQRSKSQIDQHFVELTDVLIFRKPLGG